MMDQALWNNNYPIVCVHGYCGTTRDENIIVGGYFAYAFSHHTRFLGRDSKGRKQYLSNIYEADVSPLGSIHDRACELYQQLIGKFRIQAFADKQNLTISEAVYGKDHVHEHHKTHIYKIKYLKTTEAQSKKMFAFPGGLPQWDKVEKIHIIGHSMGAATARYL